MTTASNQTVMAAARHFNKSARKLLAVDGRLHAVTLIASVARMAGSLLYRSFDFDPTLEPGTVVLSNKANEQGPKLMKVMLATLRQLGSAVAEQELDRDYASAKRTRFTFQESHDRLAPQFLEYCRNNALSHEDAAMAAAIATALLVHDCRTALPVEKGAATAVYGFVEGSKTVPFPLPGAGDASPPAAKSPDSPVRTGQAGQVSGSRRARASAEMEEGNTRPRSLLSCLAYVGLGLVLLLAGAFLLDVSFQLGVAVMGIGGALASWFSTAYVLTLLQRATSQASASFMPPLRQVETGNRIGSAQPVAEDVSFRYRSRQGLPAQLLSLALLAALAYGSLHYGLTVRRAASLLGIPLGLTGTKLVFFAGAVLLAYLVGHLALIMIRSLGEPRFVQLTGRKIIAPVNPASGNSVAIHFSRVDDLRLGKTGNAVVLEIVHPDGVLKIPKNMIENDDAFAALMYEIQQRVHAQA